MKVFGFLAVLAAGIVSVASGSAHAMPITLNFSGAILDPSDCPPVGTNCSSIPFAPSPGGIFSPGQSVSGSIVYDAPAVTSSFNLSDGSVQYTGVARDLAFSVATAGGPYAGAFTGATGFNNVQVCGLPTCLTNAGEQYYFLAEIAPTLIPPPVAGTGFGAAGLYFLSNTNPLSSSDLLPGQELLSFIEQSEQFLFLVFGSLDKCGPSFSCFVWAKISVTTPDVSAVPEPAGGLFGIGLIGMIALRRRKKAFA